MDLGTLALIILGLGILVGLFAIRSAGRRSPAALGSGIATHGPVRSHGSEAQPADGAKDGSGHGHC
jgi:hypothetical protein